MFKVFSFRHVRKGVWLLAVLCVIALGASACQISPSYSSTATRTRTPTATLSEDEDPDEEATETPTLSASIVAPATEVSGQEGGEPEDASDVCYLISAEEAEEVLGQPVTSIRPGVDDDSLSGQTINYCTYMGQGQAVVLSVVETGSLESVGAVLDQELENLEEEDEVPSVLQVTGLGDAAYWTTTSHAGGYLVQAGTVVFSVNLGGNIGDPVAHQEALLALATLVAGRL